jgi:hypothetical protein
MQIFAGQEYYNVGKDIYYGDNGWSTSPDANPNSNKATVDVAAAPFLFSAAGAQSLIDRTTDFHNTTDQLPFPAGSTGWCFNWLSEQCVTMYGAPASQYGDRISRAMDRVADNGDALTMPTQYGLNALNRRIIGSGSTYATRPIVSSMNGAGESLVNKIGNSPGKFLFALSPGAGFHCTFILLDNTDVQNRIFYKCDNHGVAQWLTSADVDNFYRQYTQSAIDYYSGRNNDWDVGLLKWILKE